jgi:integrase
MTTVKMKFRPSTVEGKDGALYYQVIHRRCVRQISTDYRIPQSQWDECKHIVLDEVVRHRTQYDIERINCIIRRLEYGNPDFTADDVVREFYDERCNYTLSYYMTKIIESKLRQGKRKTAEGYHTALNSFMKFRGGVDVTFNEMTGMLMEEYQAWLVNDSKAMNTVSFYMRKLRATYNRAVDDELVADKRPFKHVFTGSETTKKRALSVETMSEIKNADLSDNPKMDFARNMFVLSFFLRGMAFVDMAFLKKSDLRNGILTYRRHKTNQQLQIRWTKEMQQILDKYPPNDGQYLLPIICPSEIEDWRAYLNAGRKVNYHLKHLGELLNIGTPTTFYRARHSWASIAHNKGVSISVISEGLGHDSERTTRVYLASLDTTQVDNANMEIIRSI